MARQRKRVELKDPNAMRNVALKCGYGLNGLQVDQARCIELLREAADLGYPAAQYQLGNYYDNGEMGLELNEGEALKYSKEAAERGHDVARHNLGCEEFRSDNHLAAMRHFRLSASGGAKWTIDSLILCFENGLLHHDVLAKTLHLFYRSRAEMKSEDRDKYTAYLKMTGKYKEEYDL